MDWAYGGTRSHLAIAVVQLVRAESEASGEVLMQLDGGCDGRQEQAEQDEESGHSREAARLQAALACLRTHSTVSPNQLLRDFWLRDCSTPTLRAEAELS